MRHAATDSLVLALDVGTTGVRAVAIDAQGGLVSSAYRETLPDAPAPGLVEHPMDALWAGVEAVLAEVGSAIDPQRIRGLGITTTRATAVVWETATGRAVHPAISWQDGRTHARCEALMTQGILMSPLMAASKVEWILDRVDPDRAGVTSGRLRCGTLDAWIVWRLSGGRVSATDPSNASASGFYDLFGRAWQAHVCAALRIPVDALPALVDSSAPLGVIADGPFAGVTIGGLIGDQQAATMGQLRLAPGELKISYGTAAMVDMNVGPAVTLGGTGAYPLVLWQLDGTPTYCLEGTAITAGAAITWLRDGLGIIATPEDSAALAASIPDAGGAWCIPAFQGLGTPYLDTTARAVVGGMSRATTRAHVVRAVLEGIAWRCREVYDALREGSPHPAPSVLRADGGASRNDVLMQAQADALGFPVERPVMVEATALGAAYLAGLATGVWGSPADLGAAWRRDRAFEPRWSADERESRFAAWRTHVAAARTAS